MIRVAESILRQRRRRAELFSSSLFGEAGWDMLLQLYVQGSSGSPTTVEQLLETSTLPSSVTLKWLRHLEAEELVIWRSHPSDQGVEFVEITAQATSALETYLQGVREP